MEDPYKTLNLPPGSPWAQVETSFRHLAEIHHPRNGGDQRHFSQLLQAYEQIRRDTRNNTPPTPLPPPQNQQSRLSQLPPAKISNGSKSNPDLPLKLATSVLSGLIILFVSQITKQTIPFWVFGVALFTAAAILFAFPTIVLSLFRPHGRILTAAAAISLMFSTMPPAALLLVVILVYFVVKTPRVFPLNR